MRSSRITDQGDLAVMRQKNHHPSDDSGGDVRIAHHRQELQTDDALIAHHRPGPLSGDAGQQILAQPPLGHLPRCLL